MLRLLTAPAACAVLAASAGLALAAPTPDSGVRGRVTLRPTQPVCRIDEPCSRPYETTLEARSARSGRLLRTFRSGRDGRFAVRLAAGRYRIRVRQRQALPRCEPLTVTVRPHRFRRVAIDCDTGIR